MLALNKSGYATEVEIKVSVSDLKKDIHKKHAHIGGTWGRGIDKIKYLFFAIPEAIYNTETIDMIPEKHRKNVLGGLWNHDTIEDTGITYNDLKKATNEVIANIAYALTNEKGKTRADRANSKYYRGIRNEMFADFGKLCDRMANVKHSIIAQHSYKGEGMFAKYKKEQPKFIWGIIKPEWYELQEHILHLIMGHKKYLRYRKSNHEYAPMILHLDNVLNKGEL